MTEILEAGDISALIQEAQADARAGRVDAAERGYRRVLTLRPDSLAAAAGLVKILDARGGRAEAEAVLKGLVGAAPVPKHILAAAQQWEAWQETPRAGAKTVRIALTGAGTLSPLGAHLRVACAQIGLHPALYVGDFNQWAQDLLPPQSALYAFGPELIILLLDAATLFPKSVARFEAPPEEVVAEREAGLAHLAELLAAAARHAPTATVLLHTFALPDYSPLGIRDAREEDGQRARVEAINRALASLVRRSHPQVLLFDQERVEARHGKARVRDERMWYLASMPFSDTFLPEMAAEYLRVIRPLKGLTRKCVVLDLDNTLWGGVVGEDGRHQLKLGGSSAPGNAFYDFQLALDALRRRGILLALCSKNNEADVWPVLEQHPHMVLRRPHFAAVRVNWSDKATNIAAIARELNIGLDSLVFIDDNPAERGLVRQQLPDVLTVELPRDPALYARTLLALDVFETLALTAEDQSRGRLYQEQQERERFKEALASEGDLTAYLTGLEMAVKIGPATADALPRIAQLINKTNQFNMTTRRYTEAQVQAMAAAPAEFGVYWVSVADRFGESGLTGIALLRKGRDVWEVDNLLLSCRVLGRGIEEALLAYILDQARAAGARALRGLFVPSPKNAPAAEFYSQQGFRRIEPASVVATPSGADDQTVWELPLDSPIARKPYPHWLAVEATADIGA